MAEIKVQAGEKEIHFNVDLPDYNSYINDMQPNDKIGPAHNLLMRTVKDDHKKALKDIVLKDGQPNGMVVLQFAGVIAEEMTGDIEITLKK